MKKTLAIAALVSVLVSPAMAREEAQTASSDDALSQEVHDGLAKISVEETSQAVSPETAVLMEDEAGEEFEILDADRQETEVEEARYSESEIDETSSPDDAE